MRRLLKIYMEKPELAAIVLLVVLAVVFQARSNNVFLSADNWRGGLVRMSFLWFVGIALLASALMSLTNFGNWIKSTGGHLEAAASMGIPVSRVKIICFMLCSVLAGFAGLIQVLRLNSPLPSIGIGMELQAVAAAVIGGTALTGGIGTVFGAIVGALLIRVIDNGLVLSHVNANWFQFAIGALTVIAVIANSWLRRTALRIKVQVDNEPADHRVSRPA